MEILLKLKNRKQIKKFKSKGSKQEAEKKKGFALSFLEEVKKNWQLYTLFVPCIIWYLLFVYKPMTGVVIAFMDYNPFRGISGSEWVGLSNFYDFFRGPYFTLTLKNTVLISLYSLIFEFPASIILALMINEVRNKYFKSFIQTFSFMPYFISIVVVAGITVNFLSPSTGIVNILLSRLGFERIYFLSLPEYFRSIFVSMNIWKNAGFNALIYIAALTGVDPNLYEAAKIDGVNKWQEIFYITIPGIMPTIVVMLIMRVGSMLQIGYESIILLYQPVTYQTADIINTYVYRIGLLNQNYGLSTAVGLFNSVVALLLVVLANYTSKKFTENSMW